jgi:hypothetical protein
MGIENSEKKDILLSKKPTEMYERLLEMIEQKSSK